jgi:hypothetical protein
VSSYIYIYLSFLLNKSHEVLDPESNAPFPAIGLRSIVAYTSHAQLSAKKEKSDDRWDPTTLQDFVCDAALSSLA